MTNNIQNVVKAAREKFGEVMSVSLKENAVHADFYFVAVKRIDAPVADRPYMTITAKFDKADGNPGAVSFFWGHYDLTIDQVHAEINKHKIAA